MPKTYKHLFFDLDHTLWDFEANARHTLAELYTQFNLESKGVSAFDVFFERYSGHNERLWKRYIQGHLRQDELRWKRMWHTLLDDKIASETLSKELSTAYLEDLPRRTLLFAHTHETLTYLQARGYAMHIITNGFADVQLQKIQNSGLHPYFQQIITSEASGYKKPDKAIYDHALALAGAHAGESIMIGDNIEADVLGANAAGWHSVFVNHIGHAAAVPATYTITRLEQLMQLL